MLHVAHECLQGQEGIATVPRKSHSLTIIKMKNLKTIFNVENPTFHMDIAMEGIQDGNYGSAYQHCIEQLFDEFQELPQLTGSHRLFRFVGIPKGEGQESLLQDITSNRITLANPKNFNDPMDPILREWLEIQIRQAEYKEYEKTFKLLKNALKSLRICSLSGYRESHWHDRFSASAYQDQRLNPLMWAHYANRHKGICIEYEITPECLTRYNNENELLRLCPCAYRDHKPMTDGITLDNALKAKASCWSYEEEARLIYYSKSMSKWINPKWKDEAGKKNTKEAKLLDYIFLEGFEVKTIHFGVRTSQKDYHEISSRLLGFRPTVELYKMKFKEEDITQLESVRIKEYE